MPKQLKKNNDVIIEVPDWMNIDLLKTEARLAQTRAKPYRSGLFVGCALYARGVMFTGSNIEVLWQNSYHAEETAVLAAQTEDVEVRPLEAICISCERELFTPCGKCMDLIFKFAAKNAILMHHHPKTLKDTVFYVEEMMPFYPTHK